MTTADSERIVHFMKDETLSQAVKQALMEHFSKPRSSDVHYLAASKLALEFLDEAWNHMKVLSTDRPHKEVNDNIGL